MKSISLNPFFYNKEERIAIVCDYDLQINNAVKKMKDSKWSSTKKCWHIPCTKESYQQFKKILDGKAIINTDPLKVYLQQRKAIITEEKANIRSNTANLFLQHPLTEQNLMALKAFKNLLALKSYGPNTIRNYCNEFHHLLRLLGEKFINDIKKQHIMSYLLWLIEKKQYSEMQVHTAINAIKFYFEKVLNRATEFYDLPSPKKPYKLPSILAEEEVITIMQKIENIKHRTMIITGYAAGLRVSEIVNLKVADIDSKRMMIHIHGAKGKKDRMVPLSKKLLETLREYYKAYKPKAFLFEGQSGGAYSTRSVQLILKEAKLNSNITKKGSTHMLRHSYATHLMESGTDIRIIQELLGHNSIMTTMMYTHVSKKDIGRIESPLDKLNW